MLEFNPQPKLTKKKQKSELKKWKAKCWKLMSEWVRRRGASFSGMTLCYTCGKSVHWKEANASHFVHGKLDYDPRNIKSCCPRCNLFLSGNLGNYAIRLTDENGIDWVKQLRDDAAKHPGYTIEELKLTHASLRYSLDKLST